MKKIISLILAAMVMGTALTGCTAQDTQLMSQTPFPEFSEPDMDGNVVTNDIFSQYDVTIVNFWNNGCGTCIEEMPELEVMFQNFKEQNINLIGVGADSGEGEEQLATAKEILSEKGVTYLNVSPSPESDFYKNFISGLTGYPTTYIVDGQGNIIGAPIIGNVKKQEDTLTERISNITESE